MHRRRLTHRRHFLQHYLRSFIGAPLSADDRIRTGRLNVGNVALYQMSYIRILLSVPQLGIEPRPLVYETSALILRATRASAGRQGIEPCCNRFGVCSRYPAAATYVEPFYVLLAAKLRAKNEEGRESFPLPAL